MKRALAGLIQRSVSEHKLEEVLGVFEQMGSYHPSEPHWYLPLIGVDPAQQGRGYGSALMEHALIRCDRDQKLAYLESSNPKNISLHERHGFELLGTIQVGGITAHLPHAAQTATTTIKVRKSLTSVDMSPDCSILSASR